MDKIITIRGVVSYSGDLGFLLHEVTPNSGRVDKPAVVLNDVLTGLLQKQAEREGRISLTISLIEI
uniref:Uncharacterized protein n=1 Tax=viral metagenome TaxID=1070528 RepID=A0A6M3K062_9ZZZZ